MGLRNRWHHLPRWLADSPKRLLTVDDRHAAWASRTHLHVGVRCAFRSGLSRPNRRKKDEVGKVVPHFEPRRGLDWLLPDLPDYLARAVEPG